MPSIHTSLSISRNPISGMSYVIRSLVRGSNMTIVMNEDEDISYYYVITMLLSVQRFKALLVCRHILIGGLKIPTTFARCVSALSRLKKTERSR